LGKTGLHDVFGSFALILAFVCALYAFSEGLPQSSRGNPLLIKSARSGNRRLWTDFTATLSLVYLFFTDNYSLRMWFRTATAIFNILQIARCGPAEGSLLFWSFYWRFMLFLSC